MKLRDRFEGRQTPFEGDHTLRLRTLPAGAQISKARVITAPHQCLERIAFRNGVGDWGATKESGVNPNWEAIDLHARRKVTQIRARAGSNNGDVVTLQVDIGGLWVRLANDGTILTDGSPELMVDLSTEFSTVDIPPLIAQRLKLQVASGTVEISQLTVLSYPSNLSLGLGQTPPFWARPGELTEVETSPEFADVLQAFLAEAEVANGFYDLPLVVHSDSIACLDVTVEIEYALEQAVLPAGVTETTLPFKHNSLPEAEADLLQLELPVGTRVVPGKTSARVVGAFQESRVVYGPTGEATTATGVSISADQSQAQPILLKQDAPATAVDLLLAAESRTAVLDLVLLADTDGKPGPDPLLPAPVAVSLDKDIAEKPTWISADLPAEFQFKAGTRYWLALQARRGQVNWSVNTEAADVGLHFTDNGGLAWRQTAAPDVAEPVAGLFRLRHTPPRFQMPIELQVGTGDAAQRISLERFAPMRRVDFNLDFNEVAEAINRYLAEGGPAACPEGEHLANGDFAEWTVVGDDILPPQPTPLDGTPLVVAVSPDDRWIYVAGLRNFRFIDALCQTEAESFALEVGRARDIAVHPDGKYVYLLTARFGEEPSRDLLLIDTNSRQLVGDPIQLDLGSRGLALSPDGRRLSVIGIRSAYESDEGLVQVFDTEEILQEIVAGQGEVANLTIDEIPLGEDRTPIEAVVTPEGALLLIAVTNDADEIGEIHIVDTATGDMNVIPVAGSQDLTGISLVPGEETAIVTDASTIGDGGVSANVFLVDLLNGAALQVNENPDLGTYEDPELGTFSDPSGVVVSPDGKHAFVIDSGNNTVLIIDIARFSVTHAFSLRTEPRDIDITHQGDRVYIPVTNFEGFTFLESIAIGSQFPAEWTLTSGSLSHACFADPFHRAVVLGLSFITGAVEQSPTSISQVIPATPLCSYELTFWGRSTSDGAVAEILWLGEECSLQRTDEIAIEVFDADTAVADAPPELVLHRLRTAAPEGVVQAEVRFTSQGNVISIVDQVSFRATLEAVNNNDFQSRPAGELAAWALSPAGATGLSLETQAGALVLGNRGVSPFALVQTIAVTADQPFTLTFQGRVTATAPAQSPRLELHWLTAAEAQAAEAAILEIDPAGSDTQRLSGAVPAIVVEAELRLVLPGRTTLAISNVSFRPVELVQIPLNFIAQAPGDLIISDFRVAFDTAVAPLPPLPETGLCTPTPPGREPGSRPGDHCFCPCCGGDKRLNNPRPTKTSADRPATRGDCPDCGVELIQPGGQIITARTTGRAISARPVARRAVLTRARQPAAAPVVAQPPPILPLEEEIAAILPMTPAEWANLAGTSGEAATPLLTTIKGIGPALTEQLDRLGLNSIAALAEADPEVVATGVKGMSVEQAYDRIAEAKAQMILAEAQLAPLVSCIMLTYNRPHFVPKAIEYFLRQDYPHRELIIVDDSADSIEHLVPDDERIRYIHLEEKLTLGAKMNVGCEVAGGSIIARWEDDVWMAQWRLGYQTAALLQHQADICGPDYYLHYDLLNDQAWRSVRPPGKRPWILGSALCFTRSFWERNPFPDINLGDEIRFIRNDPAAKIVTLQATTFLVDIIHGGNIAPKDASSERWYSYPVKEIQDLMGGDWQFYRMLAQDLKV